MKTKMIAQVAWVIILIEIEKIQFIHVQILFKVMMIGNLIDLT